MECSNCGVSDAKTKLFDVISGEGIIKLCKNCLSSDNVRVNRPGGIPPGKEKKQSTYERLSSIAGIDDPQKHKRQSFGKEDNKELKKQEVSLRDLVDKKFDSFVDKKDKETPSKRDDLIDHFHWVIMRARRARKMSVSQLAKEIKEPERVIKDAERGIIPEGYDLIIKLENALNINLLRPGVEEQLSQHPKKLGFDDITAKTITISDLKEMKQDDPGLDLDTIKQTGAEKAKKSPYWRTALSKIIKKRKREENEVVFSEIGGKKEEIKDSKGKDAEKEELDKIDKIIERKKQRQGQKQAEIQEEAEDSEKVEDNTSLSMTTTFSGQNRDEEKSMEKKQSKKKQDKQVGSKNISDEIRKTRQLQSNNQTNKASKKQSKKKKEMSQEEIDDLIFGR
ncbi:hypothetical protein GF378_01255 [Candidatus Pacearchaeota archaeon]|nr:hypothetical protein [Candidatus Pacearchaeota archaeon]